MIEGLVIQMLAILGDIAMDHDPELSISDSYGHSTGDEVPKKLTDRLNTAVRSYDVVGRYGAEEFLVVLPGCGSNETEQAAERVRAAVANAPMVVGDVTIAVTISVGAVSTKSVMAPQRDLLSVADKALYEAKRCGRNRIVIAKFEPPNLSTPTADRDSQSVPFDLVGSMIRSNLTGNPDNSIDAISSLDHQAFLKRRRL